VERGKCKAGDDIDIIGMKNKAMRSNIVSVETFKKTLDAGYSF
jgi:translation elongation factor EF-Tu-like GTPase